MPKTTTHRLPGPRRDAARRATGPARRGASALAVTGLAATGLALGGCGARVPPLEDVWPEVRASIRDATSVAIDGTITQGREEMTVDVSGRVDDSSYSGSLSLGEADVRVVGDAEHTYLKPNAASYETMGGAQVRTLVGDRWLRVPAGEGGFTMSALYSAFSEDLPDAEEFGESDYTAETVEHEGEQVYRYTGMDAEDGRPVTLFISQDRRLVRVEVEDSGATDGPPAGASAAASPEASPDASPDATADTDGDDGSGTVDFSDWNAVGPVEMPDEDEVFTVPGT